MIEILKKYLGANSALDPMDIDIISSKFELKTFKQDEVVIQADSRVHIIGFIVEGILRASEIKPSGDHTIHYFLSENHFFSEANGLFKNLPAKLSIEAATPSIILTISIEKIETLAETIPNIGQAFSSFREKELIDIIDAQEILHKGKSSERFMAFKKKQPTIVNRVKDKDVAAYLGISKYTLSHIKSDIS